MAWETMLVLHLFIVLSLFKVSKDAKECMQECVSEFISFITSEYPIDSYSTSQWGCVYVIVLVLANSFLTLCLPELAISASLRKGRPSLVTTFLLPWQH